MFPLSTWETAGTTGLAITQGGSSAFAGRCLRRLRWPFLWATWPGAWGPRRAPRLPSPTTQAFPTAVHDILMQFDVLFNVSDGVNNLFGAQLVRVDSPVWSMSWELWFSLTLPLAIWCISRIRRTGLAVVATFIAVLVSYWTGYFPLRLCLMFWLGVMVARRFDKFKAVKLSMLAELALLVASVGVIELSLVWHPGGVLEALKSTAMNAACLVVVVVAIADGFTRRALSAAPMVFLGKVSYSLYLTHAMVIGALVALLPRLGIVDPLTIAAVSLPASMLVSVVFWRIIEVPSMNLSRSLASSGPRDAVR